MLPLIDCGTELSCTAPGIQYTAVLFTIDRQGPLLLLIRNEHTVFYKNKMALRTRRRACRTTSPRTVQMNAAAAQQRRGRIEV